MRNRLVLSFIMILPVLLLAGCGNDVEPLKPVVVQGHVFSDTGAPIAGAQVSALDVNDAPITGTVTTNSAGEYDLDASSARNQSIKLRVTASGFESFPSGFRSSLPISLSGAVDAGLFLVVSSPQTDVTLEPLANPGGPGSIAGITSAEGCLGLQHISSQLWSIVRDEGLVEVEPLSEVLDFVRLLTIEQLRVHK